MAFLKYNIAILFILLGTYSFGQTTFAKVYTSTGYDYGRDVIESIDSGLVVTGSSSSFITQTADALILKTDSLGNYLWSYAYGGSGSDWGNKLIQTQDSGYVIAGYTNSIGAGGFDFYVLKTDVNGHLLWDTTFGGADWDIAHSLIELSNKDIIIVGETQSFGSGNKDGYIVCIDQYGAFKWEKVYGGSGDEIIYDISIGSNDSIWLTGSKTSHTVDGNSDAWILNFNTITLDTNYTDTVGGPGDDVFYAVDEVSNRVYFSGSYTSLVTKKDSWLYCINTIDHSEYINVINSSTTYHYDNDEFYSQAIELTTLTNFQAGYTNSLGYALVDQKSDFFMHSTTFNGGYIGFRPNFGEAGDDICYGVIVPYDKAQVFVGDFKKYTTGGSGILILKLKGYGTGIEPIDITNFEITTDIETEEKFDNFLTIYPNPVSENLSFSSTQEIESILIMNMAGQIIDVISNINNYQISFSNYSKGMYLLKITSKEGSVNVKKIVKE